MVDIFGPLTQAVQGGQPSIFNVNRDISTNQLNAQLTNSFNQRIEREVGVIQSSYSNELSANSQEEQRITGFRTRLRDSLDQISNTKTRLEGVLTRLDNMIININKAKNAITEDETFFKAAGYAAAHDSNFRQLDDLIRNTRVDTNLLSSDSNSIAYPISLSGAEARIYGNDISTEYSIEDQNGDKWYPIQDTQVLKIFDNYPFTESDKPGVSMIHDQGITLNSFDGTNVDFTTGASTASPSNYTGTVTRSGLEILNSWLYDGLETSEGRERALSDLDAAKEAIQIEFSRYELVETTVNFYDNIATKQLSGVRDELIAIQTEAATEVSRKQNELAQQFQAAQSALSQSLVLKNTYRNFIPSVSSDPFTRSLLDVIS